MQSFQNWVRYQLTNIRFYILLFSAIFAAGIYFYWITALEGSGLSSIRIVQTYALTGVAFLYLALLPGAIYSLFPKLHFRAKYFKARRAIGVSAFFFALLHVFFASSELLGGIGGILLLPDSYKISIAFGSITLFILFLMAATSFDYAVITLGKKWKILHRFVYLAGLSVIIHALRIGSHFADLSSTIPSIFFSLSAILLLLESFRIDSFLSKKFEFLPRFGLGFMLVAVVILVYFLYFMAPIPVGNKLSFGIHALHSSFPITTQPPNESIQVSTSRYSVDFMRPENLYAGQETKFGFAVSFASNGEPEFLFSQLNGFPAHVFLISEDFMYYKHILPQRQAGTFYAPIQFPKAGLYRVYFVFHPAGSSEQHFAYKLNVEGTEESMQSTTAADADEYSTKKTYDTSEVTLEKGTYNQKDLQSGDEKLTFSVSDKQTNKKLPLHQVGTSFGEAILIDIDTYELVYAKAVEFAKSKGDTRTTVGFSAKDILYGVHKVFVELSPSGTPLLSDFMIKVNR